MKLGFIGYGNMASAIAKGLVSFNVIKNTDIYACARNYEKLKPIVLNYKSTPVKIPQA